MYSIWTASRTNPGAALRALVTLFATGCTSPHVASGSFRCDDQPSCPQGQYCNGYVCVNDGDRQPARLTTNVPDTDGAFAFASQGPGLSIYWSERADVGHGSLWLATLDANGVGSRPTRPAFEFDPTGLASIYGQQGACIVRPDSLHAVVDGWRGESNSQYSLRMYTINQDGSATEVSGAALPPFRASTLNGFVPAHIGSQDIVAFTATEQSGSLVSETRFAVLAADGTAHSFQPGIQPFQTEAEHVTVTMFHATSDGVWLSALLEDNGIRVMWFTAELLARWDPTSPTHDMPPLRPWSPGVVSTYLAAYPIAAHGQQLAIAYQLTQTRWQIWWLSPRDPAVSDPALNDVDSVPGPILDGVVPGVLSPGGLVSSDGNSLLVAGSVGGDRVTVWTMPWGAAASVVPTIAGTIAKLTTLPPRRLRMASNNGNIQVVWTERVPADTVGDAEYYGLFTSLLNSP